MARRPRGGGHAPASQQNGLRALRPRREAEPLLPAGAPPGLRGAGGALRSEYPGHVARAGGLDGRPRTERRDREPHPLTVEGENAL